VCSSDLAAVSTPTPVADQLRAHYPSPTALTAPSCEVTVSVTVSGATFRWSAVRLAERPVLLEHHLYGLRQARPARSGYGSQVRVLPRELPPFLLHFRPSESQERPSCLRSARHVLRLTS